MPSDFALRACLSSGRRRGRRGGLNNPGAPVQTRRIPHPFWSTPLAANEPVASTSADMVARLAYQAQMSTTSTPVKGVYAGDYRTNTDQGSYSTAIYVLPTDTPRVPVYSMDNKGGAWRDVLARGVPIPDPTLMAGGTIAPSGTDGSVIFLCGTELWEMWKFQPRTSGTPAEFEWTCKQGGYMRNYTTHPGWYAASSFYGGGSGTRPSGFDWGVSASGLSYLACILTSEDFAAADILHPIALGLPITGGQTSRGDVPRLLPAVRYDMMSMVGSGNLQADVDAKRVPECARFRLPAATWTNAAIDAYAAANGVSDDVRAADIAAGRRARSNATVLAKVMRCARDYGFLITETGGVVGVAAEHIKTWGTKYHPADVARPSWGNFLSQFPFTELVQVVAPTVDISVPGCAANGDPFSDDFNRADSPTTGNLWHPWAPNTGAKHPIISNQIGLTATTVATHWNVAPFYQATGDQWAQHTVTALGAAGTHHPGIACRFREIDAASYLGRYNAGTGSWEILRVGGSTVASVTATAPTLPYTARIEAQGTTIRLLVNGSQVASGTNTDLAGGGAAIGMRWNTSADEVQRVDSFSCGAL